MAGWENVAQNNGVSIAIAGIVVVFGVLTFISGFIAILPRLLSLLPEAESHEAAPASESRDAAIAAAAGFAFHLEATGDGEPTKGPSYNR